MIRKHVVITHHKPQVSDLLLQWLLNKERPEEHTGIEQGLSVRYLRDGGRSLRDEEGQFLVVEDPRTTYSGVGGGEYDEHGKHILECEASLIGRDLGLVRDVREEDKRLPQEEVRRHTFRVGTRENPKTFFVEDENLRDVFATAIRDDIQGSPPFSLGNMITTMYGIYPEGMRRVANFAFRVFDAAYKNGPIRRTERAAAHKEMANIIFTTLARIEERKRYHELAGNRIRQWLQKRRVVEDFEPLHLVDVVTVLKRAGANYRRWMLVFLHAELAEQHHFFTVTAEEAKKARLRNVILRISEGSRESFQNRVIAIAETGDPYVHKYLFSAELGCDAVVVIKKNSRGQVQIFPGGYRIPVQRSKTGYARLSLGSMMEPVAVFIRQLERKKQKLPPASWEELISDHGPKDDLSWFYYSKTGWLMNGSLTATDVPPTALSLKEIEEAVIWGIDDAHRERREIILRGIAAHSAR